MANRVFLIVLDSFGIGGAPDAERFNDEGSNTLAAVLSYSDRPFPNLEKMGLLSIDGENDPRITGRAQKGPDPPAFYACAGFFSFFQFLDLAEEFVGRIQLVAAELEA